MRIKKILSLPIILLLFIISYFLFPIYFIATDPPHATSVTTTVECNSCHSTHNALGGPLTSAAGNVNLCQSCHNSGASAMAKDIPISNNDKAYPGQRGTSHNFDVLKTNATYGATSPANTNLDKKLWDNKTKVVCSTCHDQHDTSFQGTDRVSVPKQITALGSTGAVGATGTYNGAIGKFYLIEITGGGARGVAQFRYSKDNGSSWSANVVTAATVALDSGISATFTVGNYAAGERWQFVASYHFLRIAMDSGDNTTGNKFCRDCHTTRVMDQTAVETYDGFYKHHPVGIVMGANGRGYDRAIPLDANGGTQGSGQADTNKSNDLKLDSTGRLQCISCHGVHFADSNSMTEDYK